MAALAIAVPHLQRTNRWLAWMQAHPRGEITLKKITIAMDVGTVVNPNESAPK